MTSTRDGSLLDALLDSWDRNNTILVNLVRALPTGGLEARALAASPTVAELVAHVHYVRLVFVLEDAPECASPLPSAEWATTSDIAQLTQQLDESARAVREAVRRRLEAGRDMDRHYDHPILFLQHMIWHEGYHHGQIKLALMAAGHPLATDVVGPLTWGMWMRKRALVTSAASA